MRGLGSPSGRLARHRSCAAVDTRFLPANDGLSMIKREMAFAGGIVATMAAMLLAVVDQIRSSLGESAEFEPSEHFSCDRTGFRHVHCTYIVVFNGD